MDEGLPIEEANSIWVYLLSEGYTELNPTDTIVYLSPISCTAQIPIKQPWPPSNNSIVCFTSVSLIQVIKPAGLCLYNLFPSKLK